MYHWTIATLTAILGFCANNGLFSQSNCGTRLTVDDSTWFYELPWVGNNQYLIDHLQTVGYPNVWAAAEKNQNGGITPALYRIPIQAVIVHRDDGSLGIEEFEVDQYIQMVKASHLANNTGVQFYLICSPIHLNNTYLYQEMGQSVDIDTLFNEVDTE